VNCDEANQKRVRVKKQSGGLEDDGIEDAADFRQKNSDPE